jgi:hypothetical protein
MNKIEQYRKDALRHLELCESRYKDAEWTRVPMDYARRWADAFDGEGVDLDALANIVRDAESEPGQYDILFHTRLVSMRQIYHELWEEFMNDRIGGGGEQA